MSSNPQDNHTSKKEWEPLNGFSTRRETESERTVSDEARGRLDRHRTDLSHRAGGAAGEIERLRLKQTELEREKQELQQLARKQDEYEQGKREMMEKLVRSVALLDKERDQAVRMSELLAETRKRFSEQLANLERIREDEWSDGNFKEELETGLAEVEAAKTMYKKALARIEASSWHKNADAGPVALDLAAGVSGTLWPRNFRFWLKAGLAFSLPLAVVLVVLYVSSLFTSGFFPGL